MTTSTEARRRTSSTIRLIASYRGARTDRELAALMGAERATINRYTNGTASPNVDWLEKFGRALKVPAYVLLMSEDDAMRWVIEHAPNGRRGPSVTEEYESAWTQTHPVPHPVPQLRLVAPIAVASGQRAFPLTVQPVLRLVS